MMVLGKVKSGAASPTFRCVFGAAGPDGRAGVGDAVGVCAAASDAVTRMKMAEISFLSIEKLLVLNPAYCRLLTAGSVAGLGSGESLHPAVRYDNEISYASP